MVTQSDLTGDSVAHVILHHEEPLLLSSEGTEEVLHLVWLVRNLTCSLCCQTLQLVSPEHEKHSQVGMPSRTHFLELLPDMTMNEVGCTHSCQLGILDENPDQYVNDNRGTPC